MHRIESRLRAEFRGTAAVSREQRLTIGLVANLRGRRRLKENTLLHVATRLNTRRPFTPENVGFQEDDWKLAGR